MKSIKCYEPISLITLRGVLIGFRRKSFFFDDPIAAGAIDEGKRNFSKKDTKQPQEELVN